MKYERRTEARFKTSIPVGIRFSKGANKEGWGRILNISPGGLLLETRFQLSIAGVVYVSFSLKDAGNFENLRAHVMRVSYQDGYYVGGVAFDEVVDKDTLGDVISALAYEGRLKIV